MCIWGRRVVLNYLSANLSAKSIQSGEQGSSLADRKDIHLSPCYMQEIFALISPLRRKTNNEHYKKNKKMTQIWAHNTQQLGRE